MSQLPNPAAAIGGKGWPPKASRHILPSAARRRALLEYLAAAGSGQTDLQINEIPLYL